MARRRKNTRWEEREERVPRSRKELIGYIYALTNALDRDFGTDYTVDQINRMSTVDLKKDAQRLAHWLRTSGGAEAIDYAYSHAAQAHKHLARMVPGGFSPRATKPKRNPRSRKNSKMTEVYFFDGLARRDGQYYEVNERRTIEMFGLTPDEMDDESTMMSESDWRYLRPVKAKLASAGSETAHYRNPKRRKNIMSSAAGSYDDYGSSHSPRSYKRDRNPYSKRYTLASFSKKYWGQGYEEVDRTTRMAFWDDFKYAFIGGLGRYKEETRG
jgi:hypothetical protein